MSANMSSLPQIEDAFVDSRDFARIARAIRYIDAHFRRQPRLADVAGAAGLSEFHFNRLFRRWAGVTPKQYLAFVTGQAAKAEMAGESSVLEAAYAVGLSSPSRLHDLMVTLEAVTPGELKARGAGLVVRYGLSDTPFGSALVATTARGVCHLAFVDVGEEARAFAELREKWPHAEIGREDTEARHVARQIWSAAPGVTAAADVTPKAGALRLAVAGTNFQIKVWQALLQLGAQGLTTYAALAESIGQSGSARAVGNAVGSNPVGWLIPCHHVLRKDGALGGYRWGEDRKRAMLAWRSLGSHLT
jgi:AraC family transcriptional regulator of adaptative response/methylated-DNA-[protein]-cysteine methyltransferase